jgi:hypothetical protein
MANRQSICFGSESVDRTVFQPNSSAGMHSERSKATLEEKRMNKLTRKELIQNFEVYMRMITLMVQDIMKFNPRPGEREDDVIHQYYTKAQEMVPSVKEKWE